MRIFSLIVLSLLTGLIAGCVPEGDVIESTPVGTQSANVVPAAEFPVASTSQIASITRSWGDVGYETIIARNGSFQKFTTDDNGRRRLFLEGYIGTNSSGNLIEVLQRYNFASNNWRPQNYDAPVISRITLGTEQGIPVMTTMSSVGDPCCRELKFIRTSDHQRGYDIDFRTGSGGRVEWYVESPQQQQRQPSSTPVAPISAGGGSLQNCVSGREGSGNLAGRYLLTNNCGQEALIRVCRTNDPSQTEGYPRCLSNGSYPLNAVTSQLSVGQRDGNQFGRQFGQVRLRWFAISRAQYESEVSQLQ